MVTVLLVVIGFVGCALLFSIGRIMFWKRKLSEMIKTVSEYIAETARLRDEMYKQALDLAAQEEHIIFKATNKDSRHRIVRNCLECAHNTVQGCSVKCRNLSIWKERAKAKKVKHDNVPKYSPAPDQVLGTGRPELSGSDKWSDPKSPEEIVENLQTFAGIEKKTGAIQEDIKYVDPYHTVVAPVEGTIAGKHTYPDTESPYSPYTPEGLVLTVEAGPVVGYVTSEDAEKPLTESEEAK